jgi:hypothetical protein
MGNTLFNTTPANTYPALIKVGDNTAIDATLKALSDGEGNDLPMEVSSSTVNFTGDVTGIPIQSTVGMFVVKLEFAGGKLIASPFISATDTQGNSILSAAGYTFTRAGDTSITIGHPLARLLVNFNRLATNTNAGPSSITTAAVSGSSSANLAAIQLPNKTSFTINSLATGSGLGLTGQQFMYITWQVPSYNFG